MPSFTLTLDPEESYATTIDQSVPLIIPSGKYEYSGYVGEVTNSPWDADLFDFIVTKPRPWD